MTAESSELASLTAIGPARFIQESGMDSAELAEAVESDSVRQLVVPAVTQTCLDHQSDWWLQEHEGRLVDCWARILVAEYHRRRAAPADGGRNTEGGKVM